MSKAKEISALWKQIKPQIGELARLCHEVESHAEVTADAYQRGYEAGLNDKKEGKATCQYCEYEYLDETEEPCKKCCKAYMNKYKPKAKKEQIQVGDEVVGTYTGEEETEPFVIIRKIPEINPTYYFGIYSKSGEFCQGGLKLKKTGRHFPEIAEVLRKMGETNNG